MKKIALLFTFALLLAGCANVPVVETKNPNIFSLTNAVSEINSDGNVNSEPKVVDNKTTTKTESREEQLANSNQLTCAEHLKQEQIANEKLYSVIPTSSPKFSYERGVEMSLNLKLKNLNTTPFITGLGTNYCIIVDSTGKEYPCTLTSGIPPFEKPLLPGEEISVAIKNGRLSANFLKSGEVGCDVSATNDGYKSFNLDNVTKCTYDDSAKCNCENLGSMKVKSCNFVITADGGQAGPEGKYPLMVNLIN